MSTKEKVLNQLLDKKGEAVSGEHLAQICEVSRAAIWKAVNSLREEGYNITGTTNGGYILESATDVVSNQQFCTYLEKNHSAYKNIYVECHKEIDSTNNHAKRLLSECGNLRDSNGKLTLEGKKYHQSAFLAEHQTAGKGRLGRAFISPAKTGIYLTLIYAPEGGITQPAKLTALSAVAVVRAIKKIFNLETQIKWINDIFYNGKKVCGILTEGFTNFETGTIESAIIGIGINIEENKDLPEEIKNIAGGLFAENEKHSGSRCELAAEITAQCFKIFQEEEKSAFEEYKKYNFLIGKEVTVYSVIGDEASAYKAKAVDIDCDASLIVETENGTRKKLNSGEVSLKSSKIINN